MKVEILIFAALCLAGGCASHRPAFDEVFDPPRIAPGQIIDSASAFDLKHHRWPKDPDELSAFILESGGLDAFRRCDNIELTNLPDEKLGVSSIFLGTTNRFTIEMQDGKPNVFWHDVSAFQTSKKVQELSAIANRKDLPDSQRAEAVFALFASYVRPNQPQNMKDILIDPRWLDEAKIYPCFLITGLWPLPLVWNANVTSFSMVLFPNQNRAGSSGWAVYFNLYGGSRLEAADAFRFLRGQITNDKIVAFALIHNRGLTLDRYEVFSTNGVHCMDLPLPNNTHS